MADTFIRHAARRKWKNAPLFPTLPELPLAISVILTALGRGFVLPSRGTPPRSIADDSTEFRTIAVASVARATHPENAATEPTCNMQTNCSHPTRALPRLERPDERENTRFSWMQHGSEADIALIRPIFEEELESTPVPLFYFPMVAVRSDLCARAGNRSSTRDRERPVAVHLPLIRKSWLDPQSARGPSRISSLRLPPGK